MDLKQTRTVAEYTTQFQALQFAVTMHNPNYDDMFFTPHYIRGLKEEIRAPIALHRPRDVETVSALALLQEEELSAAKHKPFGRGFTKGFARATTEKVGAGAGDKLEAKNQKSEADDKLTSLKQYRRKNGLCFKCGAKWSTNHTCPEQIPLHKLWRNYGMLWICQALMSQLRCNLKL